MPVNSLVGKADELGDSVRQLIRAYHGSPYDFDKFDASKIGTGEGNQSFGHGLYFAGAEPTAKYYRDVLAAAAPYQSAEQAAAEYLAINGGDAPSALKVLSMHAAKPGQFGYGTADQQEIIRRARELVESGVPIAPRERTGHMYEVEIRHPEGDLLDLDAAVLAQPPAVQRALGEFGEAPQWFSMGQEGWSGKNAYTRMANVMAARNPRIVGGYHVTHDMPAASAALLRAGVPGVRYFDQGSRAVGDGTRNYVMFPGTEDSIRILRKYGLLAPMAVGAASQGQE